MNVCEPIEKVAAMGTKDNIEDAAFSVPEVPGVAEFHREDGETFTTDTQHSEDPQSASKSHVGSPCHSDIPVADCSSLEHIQSSDQLLTEGLQPAAEAGGGSSNTDLATECKANVDSTSNANATSFSPSDVPSAAATPSSLASTADLNEGFEPNSSLAPGDLCLNLASQESDQAPGNYSHQDDAEPLIESFVENVNSDFSIKENLEEACMEMGLPSENVAFDELVEESGQNDTVPEETAIMVAATCVTPGDTIIRSSSSDNTVTDQVNSSYFVFQIGLLII